MSSETTKYKSPICGGQIRQINFNNYINNTSFLNNYNNMFTHTRHFFYFIYDFSFNL